MADRPTPGPTAASRPGSHAVVPAGVRVELYAATLAPAFWLRIMRLLAPLFGCEKAMVVGIDHTHPRDSLTETLGFSPAAAAVLANRRLEDDFIWQASTRLPEGTVYRLSDLVVPAVHFEGPLYRHVAVPERLDHFLATVVESRAEGYANLSFFRAREAGDFTAAEVGLLTALGPHLQAAAALARRVALGDAGREGALRSFDRAQQPLVVLDRSGFALHVNEAASRLLAHTDGARLKFGRFLFDGLATQSEFERAVRRAVAVTGSAAEAPEPCLVRVPRGGRRAPLAFSVIPCAHAAERAVLPPGAGCVVLIFDADAAPRLPLAQLEQVYRLTPAEVRVCEAVFRTGGVDAAAAELSLSHHTVRSHLKAIYAKLGVTGQSQLQQRLANSLPMMATAADGAQQAG